MQTRSVSVKKWKQKSGLLQFVFPKTVFLCTSTFRNSQRTGVIFDCSSSISIRLLFVVPVLIPNKNKNRLQFQFDQKLLDSSFAHLHVVPSSIPRPWYKMNNQQQLLRQFQFQHVWSNMPMLVTTVWIKIQRQDYWISIYLTLLPIVSQLHESTALISSHNWTKTSLMRL